jgi:hypothetical protein
MKQEMSVLGIDIAKRVMHAVGMDERGKIVFRKRLSRHDLIPFLAKLSPVLIGLEAGCGFFATTPPTLVSRFCRKVRFLGQNPKIEYQEFNELQTLKRSKKPLCDRTLMLPGSTTTHENRIYKATVF